jgi:mannose-6-phosphate isomerase
MKRTPSIINKPWGTEEVWASTHHSVGKLLKIKAGHRLSRKYHRIKNHTLRVLEGVLTIEIGPRFEGDTVKAEKVHRGMGYYLESRTIHRLCAEDGAVVVMEVSNQGPSDSVRLEDDYRRITDIPDKGRQSDK